MDAVDAALKWANPENFYLVLLLVLIVGFYFYSQNRQHSKYKKHFGEKVYLHLSQSVCFRRRYFRLILQCIGFVFVVVALARPQMGKSTSQIKSEGVELLLLADVSNSMLAEDLRPSRLEQMKTDLAKLIDLMPGNKYGLIAFAGSASLMSPLTSDPGAIKMYLQSLDTQSVSSQGTSFEAALSYAKESFDKGGVTQTADLKTTRVILIASDGEDQEPGAIDQAKKLAQDGVHILTVAYGTEKGGSIPVRDQFGQLMGSKKDRQGQVIITQVKGDFLRTLAETARGSFNYAMYDGSHLKELARQISEFEKTQFSQDLAVDYDEKYIWPLSLGFALLFLSLCVSDRRRSNQVWKGRYEI